MEEQKSKGINRFIAFLLIAATVVSIVVFVASGNEADGSINNPPDNSLGQTAGNENDGTTPPTNENGNNDQQGADGTQTTPPANEQAPTVPVFIHTLTGLEITEEEKTSNAFGIVIDPSLSTYGLSYADIAIEFPIEDGSSRMLFFSSSPDTVWKIGALAPTRDYITAMTAYFGGVAVSNGRDDSVVYKTEEDVSAQLDLSKHADCYYVENGNRIFTNENLINVAFNRTQLALNTHEYSSAPFTFTSSEITGGIKGANKLIIPYSTENVVTLSYNETTDSYDYFKNSEEKIDMLTGQSISFTNVFVLFADSTTYESASSSETVFDTASGGKGYYLSGGIQIEFTWGIENGALVFRSLSGDILEVNPGNSYITYYKSSSTSKISVQN